MVNVVVTGIPGQVPLPKFMKFVKRFVLRCKKEIPIIFCHDTPEGYKEVSYSVNFNQALKSKKVMDKHLYIYENKQYPLKCWLENLDEGQVEIKPPPPSHYQPPELRKSFRESKDSYGENRGENRDPYGEKRDSYGDHRDGRSVRDNRDRESYEPPQKSSRYESPSRDRSRSRPASPPQSNELRAIELKIELIRKQRILMEEETKLLLEKRKLEYLQNLGSQDYGNLARFEEIVKRNDPSELSEFLASPQSSVPERNQPKAIKAQKLPDFARPCKEIIAEMQATIRSRGDLAAENRRTFYSLLRSTLRKRLAVILEGKVYLPIGAIMKLYRSKHPVHCDENLVDELLNTVNISTCYLPIEGDNKISKAAPGKSGPNTDTQNTSGIEYIDFTRDDVGLDPQTFTRADGVDPSTFTSDDGADPSTFTSDDGAVPPTGTSQLTTLDEYVDMENDVDDWVEDDAEPANNTTGEQIQSSDKELNTAFDEGTQPETADSTVDAENARGEVTENGGSVEEVGEVTPPEKARVYEEVSEAVLIVNDTDTSEQKTEPEAVEEKAVEETGTVE